MGLNKKGLPVALLNRIALWAVVFGCIAAFVASMGENAGSQYSVDLFNFISAGVSIGAGIGWLHYMINHHKR